MPVYQREQRVRELRELRARIDHEITHLEAEINAGRPGQPIGQPARRAHVPITLNANAATIRAWARDHGIHVGPRGCIGVDLREQYAAAHPEAS